MNFAQISEFFFNSLKIYFNRSAEQSHLVSIFKSVIQPELQRCATMDGVFWGKSLIGELLKILEQRLSPPFQDKLLVEQFPLKRLC